jgi:hypothetical protein
MGPYQLPLSDLHRETRNPRTRLPSALLSYHGYEVDTTRSGPGVHTVSDRPTYVGQDFSFVLVNSPFFMARTPSLSFPYLNAHHIPTTLSHRDKAAGE